MVVSEALARRRAAERAKIAAALIFVVAAEGYEQTTLAMVLERAGLDEAAFHRHFADVEDCAEQVAAEVNDDVLARARAAIATTEDWRGQVRSSGYALLGFLVEDPRRARFLFLGSLSLGGRTQLLRDQTLSFFTDLIHRGRFELDDPDSVSRATAEGAVGAIYYRIQTGVADGGLDSVDAVAELFRQLIYTAVLPYLGADAALAEMQLPWPDPAALAQPEAAPAMRAERRRLVEALYDVVLEKRLQGTTVRLVLERAGLDEAAFHRHFADVEDAYCQVVEALRDEFLERVQTAFDGPRGWRNQIRAVAYEILDYLQEDERRARFCFVEILSAGGRAQIIRDQAMTAVIDLIDRGREELDDPDSLSRATAEGVAGAIYNRLHTGVGIGRLDLADPLVPQLMYTVVRPYMGVDAAMEELHVPPPDKHR